MAKGLAAAPRWYLCALLIAAPLGAKAQDGAASRASQDASDSLQEVVVSANRQGAQDLQEVPTSISSLNAATFDREGLESLSDITLGTAGVSIVEVGGGENAIIIRGMTTGDEPSITNVEGQSLVSVYLDDTPITLAGLTPDLRLLDFDRVEIVRGPQGTLYGAGAMAGNIRYVTIKPDSTNFDSQAAISGDSTDAGGDGYSSRAMLNAPLVQGALALRVSAYQGEDPGYIDNIARKQTNSNWQASTQLRAALRYDEGGPLTVDASFLFGLIRRGAPNAIYAALPGYRYSATSYEPFQDRFGISNLTARYSGRAFDIISSTSFIDRMVTDVVSGEVIADYYLSLIAGRNITTLAEGDYVNELHDFSEEVRLTTNHIPHMHTQLGLFYEDQHRAFTENFPAEGADSIIGVNSLDFGAFQPNTLFSGRRDPDTRQLAEFAEGTYSPVTAFDLTVGLRYFQWHQYYYDLAGGYFGAVGPGKPLVEHSFGSADGLLPKFNLAYHMGSAWLLFTEAAKGFRFGGVNEPIPEKQCAQSLATLGLSSAPVTFGPDHVWTYSLGEKATLLDQRLTVNTTAYYTKWSNIQTETDLASCGYGIVQNVGNVKSAGMELESRWRATSALTLGLNASYTDSVTDGPVPNLDAASGARVPDAPRTIASMSADFAKPTRIGALLVHGDIAFRGNMVTDFNPDDAIGYRVIPSLHVLNGSVTLSRGQVDWTVYGHNLTNSRLISVIVPNYYGSAQRYGDVDYVGAPLTVGVQISARWH